MSTIVICFSLAIPISISLSLSLSLSPYLAHTQAHNFLYIRQFQILDSSMLDFVLGFFILIMKIVFRSFQFIFLFVKVKRYINPRTINVNHSNLILALQYPSVSLSLTCTHAFFSLFNWFQISDSCMLAFMLGFFILRIQIGFHSLFHIGKFLIELFLDQKLYNFILILCCG